MHGAKKTADIMINLRKSYACVKSFIHAIKFLALPQHLLAHCCLECLVFFCYSYWTFVNKDYLLKIHLLKHEGSKLRTVLTWFNSCLWAVVPVQSEGWNNRVLLTDGNSQCSILLLQLISQWNYLITSHTARSQSIHNWTCAGTR